MTPSPMTASPAPSPIPPPSHTPQTTASIPSAQPHYPPGPSVQYGAHPAPQAQCAPYPVKQSGFIPGQPPAAYPSQPLAPPSNNPSNVNHGGVLSSSSSTSSSFSSSVPPPSAITVKVVQGDKIYMQKLESQESFESFTKKMRKLFGSEVIVKYVDEEGDFVIVESTINVQHIITLAQKKTDGLFRLIVSAAATSSSSSHEAISFVAPPFGGVGFPSTIPPSSSPYGSGPPLSYSSHPPPSLPPHGAPPQPLSPLPVDQRTFQTSHFKHFYAATPVPKFQHVVFADLMAIIKWDCERRNIDVNGEGTTFFQVLHFYAKRYFRISYHFVSFSNVCLISSSFSHFPPISSFYFFFFISSVFLSQQLQAEAFHNKDEVLSEVPAACQRL
jgi:hypothetical protein